MRVNARELVLASAVVAFSATASAQEPPAPRPPEPSTDGDGSAAGNGADEALLSKAREHFRAGVRLAARGDYTQALVELDEAQRLHPRASTAYNIAVCFERLSAHADAYVALVNALQLEASEPQLSPEHLSAALALESELRHSLSREPQPQELAPPPREAATPPARAAGTRRTQDRDPATPPLSRVEIVPASTPHPWLDVSLVALGASVLFTSTSAVVMWSSRRALEEPCISSTCPQSERDRVERLQTATQLTNAGLVLTAVTGACSFVLWQWGDRASSPSVTAVPGGVQYSAVF